MRIMNQLIQEKYDRVGTKNINLANSKKLTDIVSENWMVRKIDEKGNQTYVNNFLISDIKFSVSFQQDVDDTDNEYA